MSTLVLKGLSPELHAELKARAKAHRRSLNQEAIGLLENALAGYRVPFFEPIKPARPYTTDEVLAAIREGRR